MPYYYRFIESFPTVNELADATEESVLKHWEGLGYYSRARNLHATAKYVAEHLNGAFPHQYNTLIKLKGVGPYTAAAIASICFDEPTPVIDGNVFRFVSRYYGISEDISQGKSRKVFLEVLDKLIDKDQPGEFNQAIMEFGATVCKPSPDCERCVFNQECYAAIHHAQKKFPVKLSKPKIQEKHFHYFVIECDGQFLMKQRKTSIWKGLYEFLLQEGGKTLASKDYPFDSTQVRHVQVSEKFRHLLTHRILWLRFYHISVEEKYFLYLMNEFDLQPYSYEEVLTLPKPKSIINYLQQVSF